MAYVMCSTGLTCLVATCTTPNTLRVKCMHLDHLACHMHISDSRLPAIQAGNLPSNLHPGDLACHMDTLDNHRLGQVQTGN